MSSDGTVKGKPKYHWSGALICQRSDRAEVLTSSILNFLSLGHSDIFPVGGWMGRIEEIHLPLFYEEEAYGLRLLPLSLRCSVGVSCNVSCMLIYPFGVCVLCRVRKQSCKWSEGYVPTGLWNSSWATIWLVQGMIIIGRHRRHFLFSKFRFPYRHCHVMSWREVSPRREFSQ